jgi:hypothetical protein
MVYTGNYHPYHVTRPSGMRLSINVNPYRDHHSTAYHNHHYSPDY